MANKLTEKQDLFTKAYYTIGGKTFGSGVDSARLAGYKGSNAILKVIASQNLTKLNITSQKKVIQAKTERTAALSIETVLKQLSNAIEVAITNNDLPAIARISELQGKYLSMWSERGDNSQEEKAKLDEQQSIEAQRVANIRLLEDIE